MRRNWKHDDRLLSTSTSMDLTKVIILNNRYSNTLFILIRSGLIKNRYPMGTCFCFNEVEWNIFTDGSSID